MILRNSFLFSGLLQSKCFATKITSINKFSSFTRKPLSNNSNIEINKRHFIKIKITRHVNTELKPFALFDKKPFILPNNPFSLMFAQFIRAFTIRLEMARIDPKFRIQEFHQGAQMGLITVSNRISNGNFEQMSGLVEPGLLEKIQERYNTLTEQQKKLIAINKEEIANQRIIAFNVHKNNGLYVKFKLLIYLLNVPNPDMTNDEKAMSMEEYFKRQLDNLMMAEYTFMRDYSDGTNDSSWVITDLNHYNSDYYGKHVIESKENQS